MIIHEIHDDSNRFVIDILKKEFSLITDSKILKNYHPDYKTNPANIFYILNDERGRYHNGCYYVLEDNDEFICSAGWNQYELDTNIALVLTRAYVNPKFRARYYMGNYILPTIIKNTKKYKHLYITINSYNRLIFNYFERASKGLRPAIFNDWPEIYKKFKPIGTKEIYGVTQYVVEYQGCK